MPIKTQASIEDLPRAGEWQSRDRNGGPRLMSPTGALSSRPAFEIAVSLRAHARRTDVGRTFPDNTGFVVDLPNRKSFSPDAAYYLGPDSGGSAQ
jgi:Uma2 family endonuclease